jgi:hypothetical protein
MKTRILIVSYLGDKPWLDYCLRSIRKFCTGFDGTTIVVASDEMGDFEQLSEEYGAELHGYERDANSAKWHLHAQAQKCLADLYCPETDYILHTDSDCVFTEPVTPADYFGPDGLPVMLYEAYARLQGCPWQPVVEAVLKHPVFFEFMRRHPQVNPRGLYADFRRAIELTHHVPFVDYVLSRKPDFPWGWTEHNLLGAFAYYSPKWHGQYHWIDLAKSPNPHEKLSQFWSKGPIDKEQPLPHTGGRGVPVDEFRRLGL